ncbi:MAG: pseudouridine synthase [Gammaproteobacteria bacterium]|nr:pseudouridine synthase [Gammaproteobacteria bacterium]
MSQIILFNKPYRVLSQFSPEGDKRTLADYIDIPDVYPAGRLDYESEGLMVLTDDGKLQARITSPSSKKYKIYWAQLEGDINRQALIKLQRGVDLKEGQTLPARAKKIEAPKDLWPRNPPIRYRKNSPTCWITLEIREGKNRQVRRMTAAVGFPTLRLVRIQVDQWTLEGLKPGEYKIMEQTI